MLPINFWAVIVAAVAAFIIGFLFHGPLFGKLWIKLANIHPTGNEKFSDMYGQMVWNFVVNVVTAYALAIVYMLLSTSAFSSVSALCNGVMSAVLVWLGFLATSSSIDVIWMGKPFKLWFFEFCSSFVTMIAMGLIIAAW